MSCRNLVGELALLPEPSRLIHELLQLRRDVAEPRRSAEGDAVRPLQVLQARDRLVLDLGAMPAPVLVLGDHQLRGKLLDVAEAHLNPLPSGSLGERVREPVHVAGRAVVDNRDAGRSRHRGGSSSQNPIACRMRTTWMRPAFSSWISSIFPMRLFCP